MRITLGVTGGVAAYKAAELVRRLQTEGHTVQVVMTRAAREFITPLTFAALTGQKVITDLFSGGESGGDLISRVRDRAYCRGAADGSAAGGSGDGGRAGEIRARAGGRFPYDTLSGFDSAGGAGAGDEREYVAACRDAGKYRRRCGSVACGSWSRRKAIWHAA